MCLCEYIYFYFYFYFYFLYLCIASFKDHHLTQHLTQFRNLIH
jgi:hypothetical protein